MTEPTVEGYVRACQRSALHLEMRDGYMLDDPMFIAWQAGQHNDPGSCDRWWRGWFNLLVEATARGVVVRRARIVSEPVSQYIRFEYEVTKNNIAAGEQVRWLPRRQATDLALPGNDFWLFDGQHLLINHFTGDGSPAGKEVIELSTNPTAVRLCASAFEAVWERAIPHESYRPA